MTVRDVSFPPSRSTVSARRGIATVSMSCRIVATDCSSRRRTVGGPSGGKNDGGFGTDPGSGAAAGGVSADEDGGGGGADGAPTRGRGGVG
jgi:hypothetical protein